MRRALNLCASGIHGFSNDVDALLHAGADVNKAKNDGCTLLIIASQNNHKACVEALVRARADLALACNGKTALDTAAQKGCADIVHILQAAAAVVP